MTSVSHWKTTNTPQTIYKLDIVRDCAPLLLLQEASEETLRLIKE